MAKNVLTAEKRLRLQQWIKHAHKSGPMKSGTSMDYSRQATDELGFPVSPSHIRNNAHILNIHLPRSHKNHHSGTGTTFICTCGRVHIITIS